MQTKHTPGPWTHLRMKLGPKQKDRRCGFVINGPDRCELLPIRVCDLRVPPGMGGFGEGEANARLIAAAPDLLAALRHLLEDAVALNMGESDRSGVLAEARAAIDKATGSQS